MSQSQASQSLQGYLPWSDYLVIEAWGIALVTDQGLRERVLRGHALVVLFVPVIHFRDASP